MRLNDPELVRRQYETEAGLEARREAQTRYRQGPDGFDTAFAAVVEAHPRRVLEVGCGMGQFSERMARETSAEVVATDLSQRMVEIAASRGLDARLADVQALPFEDGEFDCAVANAMLYHVADLERSLAELHRVLEPGGRLVATTIGVDHMLELWQLVGYHVPERQFSRETGDGGFVPALRARRAARRGRGARVSRRGGGSRVRRLDAVRGRGSAPAAGLRGLIHLADARDGLRGGTMIHPVELIERKRNGGELTPQELEELMLGYAREEIPDYQLAAFCMAVFFRGLTSAETEAMTQAMIKTGETIDLHAALGRKAVDKHSTGGVGDKTSIAVGPIVAACGVPFAKMSGRGLGHTGGTLDKLESIPGFRVELSTDEFIAQVKEAGMAIIGATLDLVPADKRLYALRDVTATVDNYSLIAASIMSKKIAGGAEAIVLDVKVGDGAFMKSVDDARILAEMMLDLGTRFGREVVCLLTDMDQPLGRAVGNALEIREADCHAARRGASRLRGARACGERPPALGLRSRARRGRGARAGAGGHGGRQRNRGVRALDSRAGRRSRRVGSPFGAGRCSSSSPRTTVTSRDSAPYGSARPPCTSAPGGRRRTMPSTTRSASCAFASAVTTSNAGSRSPRSTRARKPPPRKLHASSRPRTRSQTSLRRSTRWCSKCSPEREGRRRESARTSASAANATRASAGLG